MAEKESTGALSGRRVLMVIAPRNFRDEELFEPQHVFESAGASVTIASTRLGRSQGMRGGSAEATLLVADARAEDFDAIVVVGGSGSPEYLWGDESLHHLLREADTRGRVLGAICLAGVVLARTGLLTGHQATVYKTEESLGEYQKAHVRLSREDVVTDGRYVTAVGPQVARGFGEAIASRLTG